MPALLVRREACPEAPEFLHPHFDLETRIAILRAKAEVQVVPIAPEVIEFVARKVVSNIRELEGSLVRLGAYASLTGQVITLEMAKTGITCNAICPGYVRTEISLHALMRHQYHRSM